ncbi:putative repeat protein (TIGR01451 family) [Clostridium saccharoperbutylacetonicum]|uniref:BIG2 domain-containing protein n=1 Tax=Clostridium saccharoperbutylacetonicum N1-4(HMT) TaxID=931276 RepID=M1MDS1_9CLOT|nr:Ig-like domain-containing protein [Clostridium saccharoperbutylacetonicum]AGF54538.1 hypothetical protein Cspa_c07610 [Clostridium saccharoperbutylacetonicum N1-4(HMT)]NRT58942.1 putative repeat protein (TIGR01451 family) [Clostridium saccharoperbutylacetonicum]NSB28130.1 putative repeat protein (TIGR01451 family) [Clostridium saccharoperbutylacetonicum]NSB41618.1 putative repeat protein (TIGR01451 family) [Clostridium saccharoperbutylacetonicum]
MKNYFKKFSIMFVMSLVLTLGFCVSAFAITDDGVVGTSNLNNTTNNSAVVGSKLAAPEKGWKRYDDSDSRIKYIGNWTNGTYPSYYNQKYHETNTVGSYCTFKFRGTQIRIMSSMILNRSKNITVKIDDNIVEPSSQYNNGTSEGIYLFYTKTGLSNIEHSVQVICNTTGIIGYMDIDAIDIDDTGKLIDPNESISLDKSTMNLTVGDTQQLTATTTPSAIGVTWKSSDPLIAIVDSNGKVTGIKEGSCNIIATTTDGSNLTTACAVSVIPKGTDPNPQPIDTEYITNIAHAKGTNTNNPGGEVTIIFHGTADTTLSVLKTADVKDVWIGDNFTYTLVITNTGTKTAKAVVVNDPAPSHIDFNVSGVTTTQGTVDSSSTSKNIIVNVGDIPPAGTVTIKIPATVIA